MQAMKRVLLVCLLLFAANVRAEEPVLKIAVMSDVQGMPSAEDAGMRNLERALDVFAKLRPDVVVNAGDINDSGNDVDAVRYYKARCDIRLGKLPHVACLGNHEVGFVREENREKRTRASALRTSTRYSATGRLRLSIRFLEVTTSFPWRSVRQKVMRLVMSPRLRPSSMPPLRVTRRSRSSSSRTFIRSTPSIRPVRRGTTADSARCSTAIRRP